MEDTWKPLEEFYNDTIEDNNVLLPPKYINNKEDFIKHFTTKISKHNAEDFYENLIEEKDDGRMVVRKDVYFSTIYNDGAYVFNSYIRKRVDEEELIIVEIVPVYNEWHKRRVYYKRDKNGQWIYNYFSGITWWGNKIEE